MDSAEATKATRKYTEQFPKNVNVSADAIRNAMQNTIQVGDTREEAYGRALLSIIEPQSADGNNGQTNQ